LNFSTIEDIQNPILKTLKNIATRRNKIPIIKIFIETGNEVEKKIPKNLKIIPSENKERISFILKNNSDEKTIKIPEIRNVFDFFSVNKNNNIIKISDAKSE
jgi:hypothetical protein